MKCPSIPAVLAVCLAASAASAAYHPVTNRLMTTWGEDMTPAKAWTEYPRPNLVRANWQNLNGLWNYAITPRESACPTKWDGEILVPFCVESALSGVGRLLKPDEQLWYRRAFAAAFDPTRERLLLHFGAVDQRAQVFVNGAEATDVPHEGGFLPFTLDITDLARSGTNELVVAAWDPTGHGGFSAVGKQSLAPKGCFYTRVSGIWQTVWTEVVPATHVTGYSIVTDIDKGTVAVTVRAEGNLMDASARVTVLKNGSKVARGKVKAWGRPVVLEIPDAKLWSPYTPELYDLKIELEADGSADDVVTGYFGMRKVEVRPDAKGVPRIFFNNRQVFMYGTLDQGWWPDGLLTPPSDEAMAFDISFLRRYGFNMMRKHIKIEPLRYYYLCDKMGLLVWQDMPSGGGDPDARYATYRREWKEEIDLLQTFPCIVTWIPYNEGWGQPGKAKTDMTAAWTKRYDPTRLVDAASGGNDFGAGDMLDIHHYPDPVMPPLSSNRVAVIGEFGGVGYVYPHRPGHLWSPTNSWAYVMATGNTDADINHAFVRMPVLVAKLAGQGLAAAVYTQTTDVEGEINGLMTYDREIPKISGGMLGFHNDRVVAAGTAPEDRVPPPEPKGK